MTARRFFRGLLGKSLALLACLLLVSGGAPRVLAQATTSTIGGVILDPAGAPAKGFRVVFRDVESGTQYTSGLTDAAGNYTADVPLGGRYKIDNVIAEDGVTKLQVQDVPPVSVLTAGTTRVNVKFTDGDAAQAARQAPTGDELPESYVPPWYKRPGPIVGMVLGGAALAALALSGGSDKPPASPSGLSDR